MEKGGKGTDISWSKGTVGMEKVGEIGGPRVLLVIVVLLVISLQSSLVCHRWKHD